MASLKYYVADFNGMLTELKERIGAEHLTNPRDADIWIVWQDVRGSYGDLIKTCKKYYNKKIYVVQHGRGASFDYGPPHNMPLVADKFLCWGLHDYEQMCKLGYKDRAVIVGCPLNTQIKPPVPHKEKVVLFVPVNTGKEEPENIATYYELTQIKYEKAKVTVLADREVLKDKWSRNGKALSFNDFAINFDVVAKLLPWHDALLYHGNVIKGYQDHPSNNQILFNLLRNVDAVVGLDEGTAEVMAYGHNVPVITVDGFKYRQYGNNGREYSVFDPPRTQASIHIPLCDLSSTVDRVLADPSIKFLERASEAERQLGLSYGDPVSNILKAIREDYAKA